MSIIGSFMFFVFLNQSELVNDQISSANTNRVKQFLPRFIALKCSLLPATERFKQATVINVTAVL